MRDDLIRPFQIEGPGIRGRLVRLGSAVDEVLRKHAYPETVSRLLGQALALTSVLAGALKFDGVFTLQTKGNGPVPLLVADFRSPGQLRGYAQFDAEALARVQENADTGLSVPRLLGTGYIAFTVDPGGDKERYQGIVALEGATLADCVHDYFRTSEQIDSAIRVAVGLANVGGGDPVWRAGAIMLQRLPEGDPAMMARGAEFERNEIAEDDWRRVVALLASTRDEELLDPTLSGDDLLYRLFHEDGVRVFDEVPLNARCRCSAQRAETVLASLPFEELKELTIDGQLQVTCEFCNARYDFPLDEFQPDE